MASQETGVHSCSPHSSSGGADSYKHDGTPDTRLTAFSPEGNSVKSNKPPPAPLNLINSAPRSKAFNHETMPSLCQRNEHHDDKDPFVSSVVDSKDQPKLSATASAFRPHVGKGPMTLQDAAGPTMEPQPPVSPYLSTELDISRCLLVSSPSKRLSGSDIDTYIATLNCLGLPLQGTRQTFPKENGVLLRLTNIRDAFTVHQNARLGGSDWTAIFVSSPKPATDASLEAILPPTAPEGQLSLLARVQQGHMDPAQVEVTVLRVLQDEGDLFAFQVHASFHNGALTATIEFADVNVASDFYARYNSVTIEGIQLVLTFHKIARPQQQHDQPAGPNTPASTPLRSSVDDIGSAFSNISIGISPSMNGNAAAMGPPSHPHNLPLPPQSGLYPVMYRPSAVNEVFYDTFPHTHTLSIAPDSLSLPRPYYPPTMPGRAVNAHDDLATPRSMHARPYGRRQNAMRVTRSTYYNAAGHHNHVDVTRIREGIDVRTTIMLRNIPNKVDQAMLKRIVDESSWGKYDFMYLRIDFANDCNVGYAFINFVDPLDIIDFVNARGNQRWNCFKSDKVAEISYATIQGKDCLVQKFRNSSVMLEAPHYRPKLYFTSNGPMPDLAGQEESFPEPDNQSKMKRSCENAEHVGLFTPNAGQHFRDEQRRRRSQFDRGTRLAALEEYDYEPNFNRLYSLQ